MQFQVWLTTAWIMPEWQGYQRGILYGVTLITLTANGLEQVLPVGLIMLEFHSQSWASFTAST